MADDPKPNDAPNPPEPAPATPPATTDARLTNPTPSAPVVPAQPEPRKLAETFDADYVKQLRDEAAATRLKLKEAEAKVKEHEQAKLSEAERLQAQLAEQTARVAELETQARDARIRGTIERAAQAAGVVDAEAAYRLMDLATLPIEDKDQEKLAAAVGKILDGWRTSKSYLFGQAPNGNATNPARSGMAGASESTQEFRARLYGGSGASIFDPDFARQRGGGVHMPTSKLTKQ